jgi:NTE family protein
MTIKNLILSGGGSKGFCFVGAIEVLYNNSLLNDIDCYIGTSIGSFIVSLLCLGYTPDELSCLILNFNFKKLEPNIDVENIFNLLGLDCGSKFTIFIKKCIKMKSNNENITFKELYELTKKKLIISATCLTDNTIHYFDYKNNPDLPIWLAIRMSTCVPFIFEPVKYNDKLYVDGGILDNFPIQLVNSINQSIGITVIDKELNNNNKINDIIDYVKTLFNCMFSGNHEIKIKKYINNIITINTSNYNFLKFDITSDDIHNMYNIGKICADNFLSNYKFCDNNTVLDDHSLNEILNNI